MTFGGTNNAFTYVEPYLSHSAISLASAAARPHNYCAFPGNTGPYLASSFGQTTITALVQPSVSLNLGYLDQDIEHAQWIPPDGFLAPFSFASFKRLCPAADPDLSKPSHYTSYRVGPAGPAQNVASILCGGNKRDRPSSLSCCAYCGKQVPAGYTGKK
ncbi:hypothetical protein DI09_2p290 [Mitosporidium daphniae]|uniref:Uncharacterized protein n=1 Tax=Mitosporidium daphniae TaxID=1485682 RepID=A0A098VRJ6_9MICR|nr:uncharacterized protein DI09_2p290 [Mitosporidium daphniae]KGG51652.1 hypothetical protein DI09_2p290 [Mitosporidium daphniae]|eukprot:XP_013238079.1 uncharacterized protein DI09_2p290 [Mitosporidium daphniae]